MKSCAVIFLGKNLRKSRKIDSDRRDSTSTPRHRAIFLKIEKKNRQNRRRSVICILNVNNVSRIIVSFMIFLKARIRENEISSFLSKFHDFFATFHTTIG